jgi:hypothetical protein
MPSLSAKLYEIMNIKYTEEKATFFAQHFVQDDKEKVWVLTTEKYLNLYPEGSVINEPKVLFRNSKQPLILVDNEEIMKYKNIYG